MKPIGWVRSAIHDAVDDVWGGMKSRIELDASRFTPDCLLGLDEFSHVEVVFEFDRVEDKEVFMGARRPRGRSDWPLIGIFAQRAKNRPNRIGVTVCELVSVAGLSIEVEGLDAIDGTPVLDIKPYMREFAPKGEIRQPAWATELMSGIGMPRGNIALDLFALTRQLVDIESITPNEERIGAFVLARLDEMAARFGGVTEKIEVEPSRFNIFARFGDVPVVTLSTHLDTVPPYVPFREDEEFLWGRGACDVKGIIAAMICAAEALLTSGERNFGLLFVVGEERNSAGALHAAKNPRGSRFLINGEPTENRLAIGGKGALRYEIEAWGKMAHSAYPELGESAIDKLLDALENLRRLPLPVDPILGKSTLNIGVIAGGRAPNVISDEARAEIFIRLVGHSAPTRRAVEQAVNGLAEARFILEIPAERFGEMPGFETCVVAFATDIPAFEGAWGKPYLIGPGTIHVAHTLEERVPKKELRESVEIYERMVRELIR